MFYIDLPLIIPNQHKPIRSSACCCTGAGCINTQMQHPQWLLAVRGSSQTLPNTLSPRPPCPFSHWRCTAVRCWGGGSGSVQRWYAQRYRWVQLFPPLIISWRLYPVCHFASCCTMIHHVPPCCTLVSGGNRRSLWDQPARCRASSQCKHRTLQALVSSLGKHRGASSSFLFPYCGLGFGIPSS